MKLRLICTRCGNVVAIEMDGEEWPLDPYDERLRVLARECPKGKSRAFCDYQIPAIDGVAQKDERDDG